MIEYTIGTETQVNTYTDSFQHYPAITALTGGGYVITWVSDGQDGSSWGVYAQRFDATGAAVGSETRINTYTSSFQQNPAIGALDDGGYIITWSSFGQDGSGFGVYAQRFNASGVAVGSETRINTTIASAQYLPSVAVLVGGGYVITWASQNQDGSGYGVYAQHFDATGATVGGETRINTYTSGDQTEPTIAALDDGGYVISWASNGQDGSSWGVYAQRFDATGTTVGGETRINTYTNAFQGNPAVSDLADGGYVITWHSADQDGSGYGIYAQRFNASGIAVGSETLINIHTNNDQLHPSITALDDGGYVITWHGHYDGSVDNYGFGVYAQRFDASGAAVGSETLINTYTDFEQSYPAITTLADGSYVITWLSYQDGSASGIYKKQFTFVPNTPPVAVDYQESLYEEWTVAETLFATDTNGDPLTYSVVTGPAYGTLDLNQNGSYTYTPWLNYHGGDSFTYRVNDGTDNSNVATVTFTIDPVNDVPTGTENHRIAYAYKDLAVTLDSSELLQYASDGDGDTLSLGGFTATNNMTVADAGWGFLQFTPNTGYYGNATLYYIVDDSNGGEWLTTNYIEVLDTVIGNSLNNTLYGRSGTMGLFGAGGNDTLGKAGMIEHMFGGSGNDLYRYDDVGDLVSETLVPGIDDGGYDTVRSSLSYVLGNYVEELVLTGTANINGDGNSLDNRIVGNSGNNIIDGLAGADTMGGGDGDDTYIVDNSSDLIQETSTGGNDTVYSTASLTMRNYIETLILSGSGNINAIGNSQNSTIFGNAGNNVIDGRGGIDTMKGGAGNDVYVVDNVGDIVSEDATNDGDDGGDDRVNSYVNFTLPNYVERLSLVGTLSVNGVGNALNNTLIGNTGNNKLTGGAGNDLLKGDTGNDTYIFGPNFGVDTIQDIGGATDRITFAAGIVAADVIMQDVGADRYYGIRNLANPAQTASQVANRIRVIGGAGGAVIESVTYSTTPALASDALGHAMMAWSDEQAVEFTPLEKSPQKASVNFASSHTVRYAAF